MRRLIRRVESGSIIVHTALLMAAMIAMFGLVIDLGVYLGQRRFAQNGADAAAAGVALSLAASVRDVDSDGTGVYFSRTDAQAAAAARALAGLDPGTTSSEPTGINGNPALSVRTRLALALEYWDGATWCYSTLGERPLAPGAATQDCAASRYLGLYPPRPLDDRYYQVRVTVSAATATFFPQLPASGPSSCARPAGAPGSLTCATATYTIGGPCPPCAVSHLR